MGKAKEIRVEPISRQDADRIIKALHYSGKVVNNSQIHYGVFYRGRCGGAMQFGPPMAWHRAGRAWPSLGRRYLELNRLAFADWLPRNAESRSVRWAARSLKRRGLELIQSYADACQCGDGAIYRGAGFLLLGINSQIDLWRLPDGAVEHRLNFQLNHMTSIQARARRETGLETAPGTALLKAWGANRIKGFQIRYALPLTDRARKAIVLPILPYSAIDEAGARMYRGERLGG